MKNVIFGIGNFFKTFIPNLRHRELTNGQVRLFYYICTILLAFLVSRVITDGSWVFLIGSWLATVAPDLGGLGLQKSKSAAFGKNSRSIKAKFKQAQAASQAVNPQLEPAMAPVASEATAPHRTNTQRRLDARRARGKGKRK